jgi:hypothetical protein
MSPRDTTTGHVLEKMILPALEQGGYEVTTQAVIEDRPGGKAHKVDALATRDGKRFLISLKWQQVSGTAEQKVPFEVMSLALAVLTGGYDKAYLVLGGEGWTLRDYFIGGGLTEHLKGIDQVKILSLESFTALANGGRL